MEQSRFSRKVRQSPLLCLLAAVDGIVATENEVIARRSRTVCESLCLEKLEKFSLYFLSTGGKRIQWRVTQPEWMTPGSMLMI